MDGQQRSHFRLESIGAGLFDGCDQSFLNPFLAMTLFGKEAYRAIDAPTSKVDDRVSSMTQNLPSYDDTWSDEWDCDDRLPSLPHTRRFETNRIETESDRGEFAECYRTRGHSCRAEVRRVETVAKPSQAGDLGDRIEAASHSPDDRYFVVGRRTWVYLYRLHKECGRYEVEEIASLRLSLDNASSHGMVRIAQILDIPKFSCFIAVQQAGLVTVVRIVYKSTQQYESCERATRKSPPIMVVEHTINSTGGPTAGVCLNEIDSDNYELFILRVKGTIECYHLERRRDAGVCISSQVV
jgi:hypothetical protein